MGVNDIMTIVSLIFTILGAVSGLAWFIFSQFSAVKKLVYDKFEDLQKTFITKLEYHERHDDQRFNAIQNDLWSIRVRNAAVDGNDIPHRKKADVN